MKSHRFQELDMMRGFAACWVVGVHFWYFNFLPPFFGYSHFFEYAKVVGPASTIAKFFPLPFNSVGNIVLDLVNIFFLLGYQGVHIFFILSGFGLAYSRILKPDESWINFIRKKFFRLYPTYWILLAVSFIIPRLRADLFYGYFDWWSFWRSWIILDKAIPFSWFMFPLIQFYLCFFWLFKYLQKLSIEQFLLTTFVIKVIYTFLVLILGFNNVFSPILGDLSYPGYLAISRLFEFCLGMTMAKVYASNPTLLINYLTKPVTIALAIFFEILGIMGCFTFSNAIKFFGVILPFGLSFYDAFIGFGIFVIIFNICRGLIKISYLITSFLTWISNISYELYLTQFIGLIVIPKFFTVVVRGEPSLLTATRAILLYVLIIEIGIVNAFLLQQLTNSIARRVRFAMGLFTSGLK
ncbi:MULTISPECIES: acyltransferase family protein [unclassified Microcoleus]|uniref:acyltransferase family protein n=1 Tax=unclassified Microcoleus TaxID=2642155 RepID=UPI002FD414A9